MNAIEFIQKAKETAEYIESHPELILYEFEIGEPTDEKIIQEAIKKGIKDEQVLNFYRETSNLALKWLVDEEIALEKYENETISYDQGFHIIPLEQVIDTEDWKDFTWFDEMEFYKPLHPFDLFISEACAAFWIEDGKEYKKLDMYYHYYGEEMAKLPLDFNTYLQKLIETKGFWYWQTMFTDDSGADTEELLESGILQKLFPDFNPNYYKL